MPVDHGFRWAAFGGRHFTRGYSPTPLRGGWQYDLGAGVGAHGSERRSCGPPRLRFGL